METPEAAGMPSRAGNAPGSGNQPGEQRQRLSPPVAIDEARLAAERTAWLDRSRAAWDARAARWDARARANAASLDRPADLERIWEALRLAPGARLLDAGCGSGQFALALAERGAQVTGIDLSPEMIRLARDHTDERNLAVTWRVADISNLEDPPATYDAILARMVLPFVPDVPAALRAMRRVVRPDGRLLASVPGALSPIYSASWMRHLPGGDPGNNYLLPWELEALLRETGWDVIGGWGEWGDDLYGAPNAQQADPSHMQRAVQQATATTWTIVAA